MSPITVVLHYIIYSLVKYDDQLHTRKVFRIYTFVLISSKVDVLIAALLGSEICTAAATAAVGDTSTSGASCTIAAATDDDNDATTCTAVAYDDDAVITGTCIAAAVAEVDATTSMSCLLSFPPLPPFPLLLPSPLLLLLA